MEQSKNGLMRYWPVIVFVLVVAGHAGVIQYVQSAQAEDIKKLHTGYKDVTILKTELPYIKKTIDRIDTDMREMRIEQRSMVGALQRIEAKL